MYAPSQYDKKFNVGITLVLVSDPDQPVLAVVFGAENEYPVIAAAVLALDALPTKLVAYTFAHFFVSLPKLRVLFAWGNKLP